MNKIFKYILICIGVLILEWLFLSVIVTVFNGGSQEGAITLGVGFFLALEMVVCTGVIINSKK